MQLLFPPSLGGKHPRRNWKLITADKLAQIDRIWSILEGIERELKNVADELKVQGSILEGIESSYTAKGYAKLGGRSILEGIERSYYNQSPTKQIGEAS